jgi:hypothetical protein
MTLTNDVQALFADHDLDRDDALVAAKGLGQQIIDDSKSTDTPLEGMVYEVWGLYDEGMPACEFGQPDDGGEIVFSGTFRTEDGGTYAERRRSIPLDELKALVEAASTRPSLD